NSRDGSDTGQLIGIKPQEVALEMRGGVCPCMRLGSNWPVSYMRAAVGPDGLLFEGITRMAHVISRRELRPPNRPRRLLCHVGQLVRQNPLSFTRVWLVFSFAKSHMVAGGICIGIHGLCRLRCLAVGMDAHL